MLEPLQLHSKNKISNLWFLHYGTIATFVIWMLAAKVITLARHLVHQILFLDLFKSPPICLQDLKAVKQKLQLPVPTSNHKLSESTRMDCQKIHVSSISNQIWNSISNFYNYYKLINYSKLPSPCKCWRILGVFMLPHAGDS